MQELFPTKVTIIDDLYPYMPPISLEGDIGWETRVQWRVKESCRSEGKAGRQFFFSRWQVGLSRSRNSLTWGGR